MHQGLMACWRIFRYLLILSVATSPSKQQMFLYSKIRSLNLSLEINGAQAGLESLDDDDEERNQQKVEPSS